jgi:predicted GNAT family N-acyltransferase
MTELVVRTAASPADRDACFAIRKAVFVDEQGVPAEVELDEHDAAATHLLALAGNCPVGTMRWRTVAPGVAKLERVAVLRGVRGLGAGAALMDEALRQIAAGGHVRAVLHAQTSARAFYERLGFAVEGAPFDEEGIEHIRMSLAVA